MGGVRVIISCQKSQFSHKLAVFKVKTSLQKLLWQPKLQTFFDEVIIFRLVGDEVKIGSRHNSMPKLILLAKPY